MKKSTYALILALSLSTAAGFALADNDNANNANNTTAAVGQKVSDTWIKTKVTAYLKANTNIDASTIKTTVHKGVVKLNGTVPYQVDKKAAKDIACKVNGVKQVKNFLKVVAPPDSSNASIGSKLTDVKISTAVITSYMTKADLDASNIKVDTTDGVVTLSGSVPTPAQAKLAEDIATQTQDVASVNNQLTVEK